MRIWAALPVAGLLIAMGAAALPVSAARIPASSALRIGFNGERAIDQPVNDGLGHSLTGTWRIARSRLTSDGRLVMTVRMKPPETGFLGASGPAVLFARLSLYGGVGGDVGFEKQAAPIAWVAMPACRDETRCEYVGRIELQTRGLSRVAAREPYLETPAAIVGFTLVRSFGQGRWLQMMPMLQTGGGRGTLARPGRASGRILSMGMFPADRAVPSRYPNEHALDWVSVVEGARQRLGDPSDPIATVSAQVDVTLHECGGYWMVAIHDSKGNLPFALRVEQRSAIHERVVLPDNREWTLTSHGEEGIFEFTTGPDGAGLHVGTFSTNGQDLSITADLTCGLGPSGSMSVEPATLPPVTLPPTDGPSPPRTASESLESSALILALSVLAGLWALRKTSRQRRS